MKRRRLVRRVELVCDQLEAFGYQGVAGLRRQTYLYHTADFSAKADGYRQAVIQLIELAIVWAKNKLKTDKVVERLQDLVKKLLRSAVKFEG